jgi:Transglycosylase-like domain
VRRKLIAGMLAVSVVGIPTAVAAGAEENETDRTRAKLVHQTTLDKHWKRTKRTLKKKRQEVRERKAAPDVAIPPQLEQIAQCESHGNPRAIGGGGMYRGKYQFSTATWAAVGGTGDPAAASEAEQDKRAAILYARSGPSQWPVCGA